MGKGKKIESVAFVAILVFFVFSALPFAMASSDDVIYVPDNYAKIQWAVDNASSGDTIVVKSGTYYENVEVNKKLTLRGMDTGGGKPVVDTGGSGCAIILSAGSVWLEGFNATCSGGGYNNAAIIVGSDNNTVINNTVSNNTWYGILLSYSSNNTITSNTVSHSDVFGIFIKYSRNNTLSGNYVHNNGNRIILHSDNNTITGNYVHNNGYRGISISSSSNNTLTDNYVYNNTGKGIEIDSSRKNNLIGNYVYNNDNGICLSSSSNNTFTSNNIMNNDEQGVYLFDSRNNTLIGNYVHNNSNGILLSYSGNNSLIDNIMIENGIVISGMSISDYPHDIDKSNTVNGKPVYYWKDVKGGKVPEGAGQVILVNCKEVIVENQEMKKASDGIKVTFSSNITIKNNNCSSNNNGISIGGNNNTISGNTVNNNDYGISISGSHNVITSNIVSNNNYGISLGGHNNTISGNTASDNGNGFYLYLSNSTLIDNNLNNNLVGIFLHYSSNNTITDNTFVDNGLLVSDSYKNTVEDNTVNGKPLVYLEGALDLTITDAGLGQIILVNCDNITVKNLDLSNATVGVELSNTNNSMITNNTLSNNDYCGIYLYSSGNNTLISNTVSNSDQGIYLTTSSNNTLISNTVSNSDQGIYLTTSSNNTITGNTASNNNIYGIVLYKSHYNNTITGNTASYNNYGIELYKSINNTISNNTVSNNDDYGIHLYHSRNNHICNNYFNNTNNAFDDGNNLWNITKASGTNIVGGVYLGGNYWSDYAGNDTDGDGLGDTLLPYNSSGNITTGGDWLPLIKVEEEPYTKIDVGVTSNITPASPTDLAAYLPPEYTDTDISDAIVLTVNITDITPDTTDAAYTDITINVGSMDIETCKVFKTGIGFLPEVEAVTTLPTASGEPAFSRDMVNETVTVRLYVGDPLLGVIPTAVEPLGFDTGEGSYPSIKGTHNGTIIPSRDINVSKMYTYPCAGTGGHSVSIELYKNETLIASGVWEGYEGDWHNITIDNVTGASYVMLLKNNKYNYSIVTGSYPQIIHEHSKEVAGGTISCSSFVDANGKVYYDWIPAIRLE